MVFRLPALCCKTSLQPGSSPHLLGAVLSRLLGMLPPGLEKFPLNKKLLGCEYFLSWHPNAKHLPLFANGLSWSLDSALPKYIRLEVQENLTTVQQPSIHGCPGSSKNPPAPPARMRGVLHPVSLSSPVSSSSRCPQGHLAWWCVLYRSPFPSLPFPMPLPHCPAGCLGITSWINHLHSNLRLRINKNKTRSWLWLRSWTPYYQIQT